MRTNRNIKNETQERIILKQIQSDAPVDGAAVAVQKDAHGALEQVLGFLFGHIIPVPAIKVQQV